VTDLTFQRTGHFWIDNGICGLWHALWARSDEDPSNRSEGFSLRVAGAEAVLSSHSMSLRGESDVVREAQREALKALKERLWRPTKKGKEWWYGPARFLLPQMSNPASFFLTAEEQMGKTQAQGLCDFCGRQGSVKPVGTTEFPLLVTLDKMTSFYSGLSEAQAICPLCTFASKFALFSALYHVQGGLLNLFFLDDVELLSLDRGIRAFSRLAAEAQGLRNVPLSAANVQHASESFVAFLVAALEAYKMRFPGATGDLKAPRRCHLITFSQSGKTTSVEAYAFVPDVAELVLTIEALDWTDTGSKRHNALAAALSWMWFRSDNQVDSVLREELCLRVKQRMDIAEVVAEAIFEAILVRQNKTIDGYHAISLRILIEKYERQVIGIDANLLRNTKDVGTALGQLAAETEEKSILYELRSTRNYGDFLEAIHHVLTRRLGELQVDRRALEGLLRDLDERNWKVFRALTGIYAALEYADRIRGRTKEATA